MQKRISHLFTLDIQMPRRLQGRFQWSVRRRGLIVRAATVTYETFEEARVTGKHALDQTATLWRREAVQSEAAILTVRGSVEQTRTPTDCCGSTSRRAPTWAPTARRTSRP